MKGGPLPRAWREGQGERARQCLAVIDTGLLGCGDEWTLGAILNILHKNQECKWCGEFCAPLLGLPDSRSFREKGTELHGPEMLSGADSLGHCSWNGDIRVVSSQAGESPLTFSGRPRGAQPWRLEFQPWLGSKKGPPTDLEPLSWSTQETLGVAEPDA